MAAPVQEKRFLIPVERQWKLWFLPLLALAYFGWVLFLAIGDYEVPGVTMNHWVLGGMGLFGFVLLGELFLLIRLRAKTAKSSRKERRAAKRAAKQAAKAEAKAAAPAALQAEAQPESSFARPQADETTIQAPPAPEPQEKAEPKPAPADAAPRGPSAEVRVPGEEVRGRKVIEVSLPAKSRHEGSLYAKAYVPVGTDLVVRVESLVADPADFN